MCGIPAAAAAGGLPPEKMPGQAEPAGELRGYSPSRRRSRGCPGEPFAPAVTDLTEAEGQAEGMAGGDPDGEAAPAAAAAAAATSFLAARLFISSWTWNILRPLELPPLRPPPPPTPPPPPNEKRPGALTS